MDGIGAMERKKIDEILLPYREEIPLHPSVAVGDKLMHAIQLMVEHNMRCIAVVKNNRPVGMLRLEDAFHKLGLRNPVKLKSGRR